MSTDSIDKAADVLLDACGGDEQAARDAVGEANRRRLRHEWTRHITDGLVPEDGAA
jgi:hypothetical protein